MEINAGVWAMIRWIFCVWSAHSCFFAQEDASLVVMVDGFMIGDPPSRRQSNLWSRSPSTEAIPQAIEPLTPILPTEEEQHPAKVVDEALASIHSQTLSVHQILHPFIIEKDDVMPPASLHTAIGRMGKALETIAMMVDQQQKDQSGSILLRIEHTVAGCRDVLAWLRAQELDDNGDTELMYFDTEQREVACLGSALRAPGGHWPDVLPPNAVWYGGARFDANTTNRDPEWDTFWTCDDEEQHDSYWIVPSVELVRHHHDGSVVLAMHIRLDRPIQKVQRLLQHLHGHTAPRTAPPLPPILARDGSPVDIYEDAVAAALAALGDDETELTKVVLARSQILRFAGRFRALDVVARCKYHYYREGTLFVVQPSSAAAFVGCTPETLFAMHRDGRLTTEALAGTRPRGASEADDQDLLQDLLTSSKDRRENRITADFVENVLESVSKTWGTQWTSTFGVRRLRHLQHICARYTMPIGTGESKETTWDITHSLLRQLHPTPAVGGLPKESALTMIREREGMDRGMYAGPVGYIGRNETMLAVAIRSALCTNDGGTTSLKVYAGSGLVEGSTLRGEWAETNTKLTVMSSLFPQSPVSLRGAPTPNVAWATAFCEELVRNGITQFYICPGSRSTPLTVALAKMQVQCISVHDERAAGFRAVGYARGNGRPAAVVTSSGTAVANLYPAIVEASMDGVPMLLLTADRPYENRAMGANQAIDQVKIFSGEYIRWFRDILPPSDDVPVSAALSDACHAVTVSRQSRGPVHLNLQFRENLSPDAGPIRGDNRYGSIVDFDGKRFTDVPGFRRWSERGGPWMVPNSDATAAASAIRDLASLIEGSKRGIIVVGNLRIATDGANEDSSSLLQIVSDFAKAIGFPIVAGVQSARLRFTSSAVIPFAEHMLKNKYISENLLPDLIIQLGTPLVSTAVPGVVGLSMRHSEETVQHVLVHPHTPTERADPDSTVTHRISASLESILPVTVEHLSSRGSLKMCSSDLTCLVGLGKRLAAEVKEIVMYASEAVSASPNSTTLTEPQLIMAFSEMIERSPDQMSLFLSNSMPIRDAESFLYPFNSVPDNQEFQSLLSIGSNRGASGIDGIVSSALGFAESTKSPTTLIIGDLSSLHDVGSLHSLSNDISQTNPMTTIIVNNDGGGIFSFLPVARHGETVRFNEFFGTPTSSFSFVDGARSFGLPAVSVSSATEFLSQYSLATRSSNHSVIEAVVVGRDENVKVHQKINQAMEDLIDEILGFRYADSDDLASKSVHLEERSNCHAENEKTLLLLHGWMGDSSDWESVLIHLEGRLGPTWRIVSVDLPGHGRSPRFESSDSHRLRRVLSVVGHGEESPFEVSTMANAILTTLVEQGYNKIHGIVGYSAGGRVGLAMKQLCLATPSKMIIDEDTSLVLIGAYPGNIQQGSPNLSEKRKNDQELERELQAICNKVDLRHTSAEKESMFDDFLYRWYDKPMWGELKEKDCFGDTIRRRAASLARRGRDIASFLVHGGSSGDSKDILETKSSLFLAGDLDKKYHSIGETLALNDAAKFEEIEGCGHALLIEAPKKVATKVSNFLVGAESDKSDMSIVESEDLNRADNRKSPQVKVPAKRESNQPLWIQTVDSSTNIEMLSFNEYSIPLVDPSTRESRALGIGWGEQAKVDPTSSIQYRKGFIIQLECKNGLYVGLGEVSPFAGVHTESLEDVRLQLHCIQKRLETSMPGEAVEFIPADILELQGGIRLFVEEIARFCKIPTLAPSVRAGLEMAVLSLSSQLVGLPLHLAAGLGGVDRPNGAVTRVPVNGLVTRSHVSQTSQSSRNGRRFPSLKAKVGHQDLGKDQVAILRSYQQVDRLHGRIRADANRAWNESEVIEFATALEGLDVHAREKFEYIEEPLQKIVDEEGNWEFANQIASLERSYFQTGLPYALDESLADLAASLDWNSTSIRNELYLTFVKSARGCAAIVLKPTVIGLELSLQLAQFARAELGIGAVFSSCFETGIGLAHLSLLARASDQVPSSQQAQTFPHGVGTFTMLSGDTMNPEFGTYVDQAGFLQISSLSRALYGLSLDDLKEYRDFETSPDPSLLGQQQQQGEYESSTATSKTGKEMSVVASLELPFSAETACARFTDLPSMSRWSPWISNVEYQGSETEWTVNIRGMALKWKAKSQVITEPHPGIQWQSVSGLVNHGVVEFVTASEKPSSCFMNVRMSIVPPRLLRPLFQGTSVFLEDFLREKLLKWSLEMFRDVVKADLALERGEVELGDALIGSVEGKATAIKATLDLDSNTT